MRAHSIILLLMFYTVLGNAQHTKKKEADNFIPCNDRDFDTAGDAEDCWAEEVFRKEYSSEHHQSFSGHIEHHGNAYVFAGKVLVAEDNNYLKAAAENGLLYPQLLVGDSVVRKNWKAWKSQPQRKQTFEDIARPDTLSFFALKEVTAVSTPKRRRFSCWMMQPRMPNAMYIYLEFTNEQATKDMDIKSFMAGAKLTFLRRGSLII